MKEASDFTEYTKRTFREMMKDVATSIPGYILAFDPETQLAQLQIGIERVDIAGEVFNPPPLIECPVYIYGGAFSVEIQIDIGIEGVILFSQRCIDGWVNSGGVAPNPMLRFHDFSDAYFLPGLRSQPNKLSSYSNNGVKLRNKDGTQYVWLQNDGSVKIKANNVEIDAPVTTTSSFIINSGATPIDLTTHVHGGVEPGGGTTNGPT